MRIQQRECRHLMESELPPHKPSSYEVLALTSASSASINLRFVIANQLPNVPEDNLGMEIAFDVGLLEWDYLCAEQMFYLKVDSVMLFETYFT